jgi:hypothetical protein
MRAAAWTARPPLRLRSLTFSLCVWNLGFIICPLFPDVDSFIEAVSELEESAVTGRNLQCTLHSSGMFHNKIPHKIPRDALFSFSLFFNKRAF